MNLIKGFVTIEEYITNTPNQTAILGELSTWSRTYSKDKGEYSNSDVPGYQLTSFKSIESVTGSVTVIDSNQVKEILSIVRECKSYASSHPRPYNTSDFKNNILIAFYNRIANLQFGNYTDNGTLALPEWISWTSTQYGNNEIKIWLADESFKSQYDEYELKVVPLIDELDHFFYAYNIALQELQAVTLPQFTERIQNAKEQKPETYTRILTFDFINTLDTAQKFSTSWGVLVYGQQGDDIDTMKDAITTFILDNSTHSQNEWQGIIPDLFKRTEFVFLPRWDKLAIENQTSLSGVYKSMVDPKESLAFAKNAIAFYTDDHVDVNTTILPFVYKSLNAVAVNGDRNVDSALHLDQVFPDYIPVPSTSLDFNRMSTGTKAWVLHMQALLQAAETVTEFTSVPNGMRKTRRDNNIYVSGILNNINYLVAARSNTSIYPDIT